MEDYTLSVIINCENCTENHLQKTLDAFSGQQNVELILVHNSCKDVMLKEYNTKSLIDALNDAMSKAHGKYVYIMSAGDVFYKDSLKYLLDELKKNKYDLIHCSLIDHHNLYQVEKAYDNATMKEYESRNIYSLPIKLKGIIFRKKTISSYSFADIDDHSFELEFLSRVICHENIKCLKLTQCVIEYMDNDYIIPFVQQKEMSGFLKSLNELTQLDKYQEYFVINELKKYLIKKEIKYRSEILNDEEKQTFLSEIKAILSKISINSILNIPSIIIPYKNYLLSLKYGEKYNSKTVKNCDVNSKKKAYCIFEENEIFDLTAVGNFKINILESKNNILILDGLDIFNILGNQYELIAVDNQKQEYSPKLYKWTLADKLGFVGEKVYEGRRFKFEIPLNQIKHIRFCLKNQDGDYFDLVPSFGKYAKLVKKLKYSYYAKDNYIFRYRKKGIQISRKTVKSYVKSEIKFLISLLKKKQFDIVWIRIVYYVHLLFKKKPIWLIRDNEKRAKDSGAEMFKYYSTWDKKNEIDAYFILDKDCPDYQVMKKYGKIIQPDSFQYKLYHLLADKLIDTRGGISAQYIFKNKADYVMDLCSWDYIWLIHGIMTRNESTWTNKYVLNAKMFATCNRREYMSVLDEDNSYGYDQDEVALTGLPRHDALFANKQKKILLLPTWRKHLAGDLIPGTSDRSYVENFKESDFYEFYNNLINDSRLLKVMREKGYTGDFYLHPSFMKQCNDFVENDVIKVGKAPADTNQLIGECSLLITDYSSAQFEGAYLDTPVIYPQYDADTFGENHTGQDGYFIYEDDGFGPVCYDLDSTVQAIIDYIEDDCKNKEPYQTRAREFFVHRDRNNSQRVFNQILKIDGQLPNDHIHINKEKETLYLYKGEQLINAVIQEEAYKLYNPLFHLTSYVHHIKMNEKSFSLDFSIELDERDFKLYTYQFYINIGSFTKEIVPLETSQKKGLKCFRYKLEIDYKDILLTKKSTPIFILWKDDNGYGYRGYLKYQYVQRVDTLANRQHRQLHYSNVRILENIKSSIFVRETMGNNVYLCVRDINKTDYPKERKKLKYAYWLSKVLWFHKARHSVLCFEKFASKYEESASVLFEKIVDEGNKNTYFIIDQGSRHYKNIKKKYIKYIIPKYSFKHYFYFFMSHTFISTESMNHNIELNISDPHVTLKITKGEYDYIFLQHGVMYMYCLENRSDFIKGQGFTKNSKVVVSSQTEANHFIEYGCFDQDDLIISGLPKFDRNKHNAHADKILIMPTSRDFEYNVIRLTPTESTYYKFVKNIINVIPDELKSKIVVVGHPLLKNQLESTDLKQYMPDNYIYNELLEETRLLITDYSSISYDAFYRGINVVFCWEDKDMCLGAMGYKLMLNDDNVFADVSYSFDDLPELINKNYHEKQTEEHINKYRNIVTYHDNRNTERCYQALLDGCYYGKRSRKNIKKCKINNFTKKVYSGERRIHTKLEIYDKKRMLVKNRDYKIFYFNNKRKTRMALALIVGIGHYYGFKLKRFRICDSILNYDITGIKYENQEFDFSQIAVRNHHHFLRKDIDYVVSVEEDLDLNVKVVTIQGKKQYAGKINLLYK